MNHRWKVRCVGCRSMFWRLDHSDETKCPRCLTELLAVNARGYKPKPADRGRLAKYGLTQTAFHALAAAQGGVCAICQTAPSSRSTLSVDHNHETGKVRGLLCERCNLALGVFNDDPKVLSAAAAYLRKKGNYSTFAYSRAMKSDTLREMAASGEVYD